MKRIMPSNNPNLMTLTQIADYMIASFQSFTPKQQDDVRRKIYEKITGKPYRPN